MKTGEIDGEGEGRRAKDSWPNGCKAVNRVKNSLLWSGSMNADTLRPFSPTHKHLFGVKDEKSWARRWKKMRRGRRVGRGGGWGAIRLTIKSTHF